MVFFSIFLMKAQGKKHGGVVGEKEKKRFYTKKDNESRKCKKKSGVGVKSLQRYVENSILFVVSRILVTVAVSSRLNLHCSYRFPS